MFFVCVCSTLASSSLQDFKDYVIKDWKTQMDALARGGQVADATTIIEWFKKQAQGYEL